LPLYEIVTRDTVENVRLVEAVDEQEAVELALDSGYVPSEFGQKHIGEAIHMILEPQMGSIDEWLDIKESQDYHIKIHKTGIAKRK
jgi:hypothetical protein